MYHKHVTTPKCLKAFDSGWVYTLLSGHLVFKWVSPSLCLFGELGVLYPVYLWQPIKACDDKLDECGGEPEWEHMHM